MRRALYIVLVLSVIGVAGWRLRAARSDRQETKLSIPTAEVTRGSLVVTLPVNGALESAEEIPVRSEIEGNLVQLCEDNKPVKPGDFIFQLDTKDLETQREDLARALTDAEENLGSEQADSETRIAQAQSDADAAAESLSLAQDQAKAEVERMAAQVKFAEGETARAEREFQRSQRLAQLNYIAGTKLRDAEKAFRRKQFDLEQQRAQQADVTQRTGEQIDDAKGAYELAQHALTTAKANAREDTERNRIQVAEAQRKLTEVDKKIAQCTVNAPPTAPVGGLAVIGTNTENWPERRPYRLGDRVSTSGSPVTIYNFKKMQVRCQIGEMDIPRVHTGQEAWVRPSAQSDKRYRGKVTVVEELAQESNVWQGGTPGKKVFTVIVSLLETDPSHLRPGMTADLEIVLDRAREVKMAPIRSIFQEQGKSVIYRVRGEIYERVPVKTGARNDLQIEVTGGVNPGDWVAQERPPIEALRREGTRP